MATESKYTPRQKEILSWASAAIRRLYPEVPATVSRNIMLMAQALYGVKPRSWGVAWGQLAAAMRKEREGIGPMRSETVAGWLMRVANTKVEERPILGDGFYDSPEWRRLRYSVLRETGGRCQACGQSWTTHGVVVQVDHIKPRSKYPELALKRSNLQALCTPCNQGKGAWDETDWREGR